MKQLHSNIAMHDEPNTTFYYRGFSGAQSKCRVIRWHSRDRIFIALSHIKWCGTSPTNVFEELATTIRAVYYHEVDPNSIEFFDHWPSEHSLTRQEELIPVWLDWEGESKSYQNPEWQRELQAPAEFCQIVRDTVASARAYAREHGATEEEFL